jgi:hypothetical protein
MSVTDVLFLTSLFLPVAAVVLGAVALLLPFRFKPLRTYEHHVDPVSH